MMYHAFFPHRRGLFPSLFPESVLRKTKARSVQSKRKCQKHHQQQKNKQRIMRMDGQLEIPLEFSPPSASLRGTYFCLLLMFFSLCRRFINTKSAQVRNIALVSFSYRANGDDDITIKILYCGICHTDLHSLKDDAGMTDYPVVPGNV